MLVALAGLICLLGCAGTVLLMAQARAATRRLPWRRLLITAAMFGGSVWSLHFVAMLAFHPDLHIAYDPQVTAASAAIVVGGAFVALLLWRWGSDEPAILAAAGLVLGLSIAAMHYLGVGAMRLSGLLLFDHRYVLASLLLSVVLASLALLRACDLTRLGRQIEVALWLVLAICSLHFTGMAAVTIAPMLTLAAEPTLAASGFLLNSTHLGLLIAGTSLALLIASLSALLLQQHLVQRTVRELDRLRLLGDLAHEALFIHREGRVLVINRAGTRLFALPARQLVGKPVLELFSEADAPALLRRSRCRSEDLQPGEFQIRTASSGALIPVELSCRSIEYGGLPATAVALRDLSDRKRDEARIHHLALHDALTDLPNRYLLNERLQLALDAAASDRSELAVVYLDLDRFKPVNDLHGHAVGDVLLIQVAKRMLSMVRSTDTLARVGGDEFVLVLVHRTPDQIDDLLGQIVAGLQRPFQVEDHTIEIGVSAGIALFPSDGSTAGTLMRAADLALYRAKDAGRSAVRFFESAMDAQLQARRQLERELGQAIGRDELKLFYQPIVNARTGEIETFEALIRWQHPERGLVSPAEFIPLAEQANLIARIGQWVIETACAEAASWPRSWRVSVNVSPSQFRQSDVPEIVKAALAQSGLDPSRLVIELTESVFIQDATKAVEVLTSLRALGIRLALDDFGTGYSSLSYLQRFKFDKIKVDQSFVRRLGQDADTLTIVRAIVNLAHNLGMQVTVEGVETAAQQAMLHALGCEQMQGYLFGRPAPEAALSELEQARLRAMFVEPAMRTRA
ncbi:EAL domain-containing protein [Methylorubrum populi]|uniref:bifunctional diguanylate cyclase/phosphodiesterase n=1 Tax=Methylorubrum populi TaxID=223967 RepID=UPI0031F768B7